MKEIEFKPNGIGLILILGLALFLYMRGQSVPEEEFRSTSKEVLESYLSSRSYTQNWSAFEAAYDAKQSVEEKEALAEALLKKRKVTIGEPDLRAHPVHYERFIARVPILSINGEPPSAEESTVYLEVEPGFDSDWVIHGLGRKSQFEG